MARACLVPALLSACFSRLFVCKSPLPTGYPVGLCSPSVTINCSLLRTIFACHTGLIITSPVRDWKKKRPALTLWRTSPRTACAKRHLFAALHLAASLLAGSCNFNHTGMVLITLKQVSWQAFARPLTGLTGLSTCRVLRPSFYSLSPLRQLLKDKPHQSYTHAPGEI